MQYVEKLFRINAPNMVGITDVRLVVGIHLAKFVPYSMELLTSRFYVGLGFSGSTPRYADIANGKEAYPLCKKHGHSKRDQKRKNGTLL